MLPARVVDLLAARDGADGAQRRGEAGGDEGRHERCVESIGEEGRVGEGEPGRRADRRDGGGVDQAGGHCRRNARADAEQRADQPEDATAPDAEADGDRKRDQRDGEMRQVHCRPFLGHVEGLGDADEAELESDDEHGEAADRRLEDDAEFEEKAREHGLDQAGEDRHRRDRRQPARLGGKQAGADIDRREHRRRQVAGAEEAAAIRLARRSRGGRDEAEADQAPGHVGRCVRRAGNDHHDDQIDADKEGILEREDDEPAGGRPIVDGIEKIGWSDCHLIHVPSATPERKEYASSAPTEHGLMMLTDAARQHKLVNEAEGLRTFAVR